MKILFSYRQQLLACWVLLCLVGCNKTQPQTSAPKAHPSERWILGKGAEYDPGTLTETELDDHAARRQYAWKVAEKIWQKKVAQGPGIKSEIPGWQTFYTELEIKHMFRRYYEKAESFVEARKSAQDPYLPFTDEDLEKITVNYMDWISRSSYLDGVLKEEFLAKFQNPEDLQSLGFHEDGAGGISLNPSYFSPGAVRSLFKNYSALVKNCVLSLPPAYSDRTAPDTDPDNFAPCLEEEFSADSVILKTNWQLMSDSRPEEKVPWYATDPTAIETSHGTLPLPPSEKAFSGTGDHTEGGWQRPDENGIYRLPSYARDGLISKSHFALRAMHIMTKENRDWLWISLWWSPNPNQDFGADRPPHLQNHPLRNYKLCVVTGFDQTDPDPARLFLQDSSAHMQSLGESLQKLKQVYGSSSWCSNPYLENQTGNVRTNCIGCHQHALTSVLDDTVNYRDSCETEAECQQIEKLRQEFPAYGKQKVRNLFPGDYVFSLRKLGQFFNTVIKKNINKEEN